jgi:hypothetical protein
MKLWTMTGLAMASMVLLQGCATTPMGPTVAVMPGPGKPFEQFAQDQALCQQYAYGQTAGQAEYANQRAVGGAVLGTVLGAGLGAAVGGGRGAGIGAASGAALGTGIGANGSAYAQGGIQMQYDNAYASCMIAKGNRLPQAEPVYVQPAPYMVQPPPYAVQPGYPPPDYPPPRGYGY